MPISSNRVTAGFFIASVLAIHGRRKNLTVDGAITAFFIGLGIFSYNLAMGIMLIVFYLSSSKLTHYKKQIKMKQEEFISNRDYIQVLCNSLWLFIACLVYHFDYDKRKMASLMAIGVLSCCAGDTWASEVGSVVSSAPILITTLKRVPPGTNGGISLGGTIASFMGGLLIGISYYILLNLFPTDLYAFSLMESCLLGSAGGFVGSMLDSLMGATIQATYWCEQSKKVVKIQSKTTKKISGIAVMTNEAVNLISSLIIGLMFAAIY
jgi:uncharacterized protein (TIGR00297 family)